METSALSVAVIAWLVWLYLRVRVRHLTDGCFYLERFRSCSEAVCQREILESEMKLVIGLTEVTGTGLLTRHLFRRIVTGRLAEAASRDLAAKLGVWDGHLSEQTKALFVETVYSALRADSYFAGVVVGTLFRRAAFYLNATPREISLATDAMETKLLFLGAQEAVGRWTDSNTLPWKWLSGKPIVR